MNQLRCRRPYDENAEWTEVAIEGEEEETILSVILSTLGRQDWEMEQFLDGEWEPLEVEE